MHTVRTEAFEGPFDLLLHLILREEVDLYEITLSEIVDAYLAELRQMEELDLEVATEFLLIAAILVELKARRLLPVDEDVDLEDEFGLWEQRDLLLSRLVECKTFKDASSVLARLLLDASRCYPRTAGPEERFLALTPDVLEGVTPEQLRRAFFTATAPKPEPRVALDHIAAIRATVTDAVTEILSVLRSRPRTSFRELTSGCVERVEVVVRFLAVLELYKQGLVELRQVRTFGEIEVELLSQPTERSWVDLALVDAYDG